MQAFAGENLLLPEQVWDGEDVPDRELFAGGATGSARPLVWAHAEYVKLCRSIRDGQVFDQPPQTAERYLKAEAPATRFAVWRFNNKTRSLPFARILRIETLARTIVHVGVDGWSDVRDIEAVDTGLGVWVADLDTGALPLTRHVKRINFTFYWPDAARWEEVDFEVLVAFDTPL
jgi:glucoamylase